MAIPDFQTVMRPLLEMLSDGGEHPVSALYTQIAEEFALTEAEKAVRIPSGSTTYLASRVGWALSHMKAAGLVESPSRAHYRISQRGQQVRQKNPQRVDMRVLDKFPEYVAFRTPRAKEAQLQEEISAAPVATLVNSVTPEEAISQAYQELRAALAQELLEKIKQSSPVFFERLVVEVLLAMGYGGSQEDAGRALGRSGDGGIDGVIREDKLGLDVIYLQAKRWQGVVGRPIVHGFVGAIHGAQATKGVIITTSDFTMEAKAYVKTIPTRIVLVDGRTLAELMIDHNVAVSRVSNYEIKKVDNDYFSEV